MVFGWWVSGQHFWCCWSKSSLRTTHKWNEKQLEQQWHCIVFVPSLCCWIVLDPGTLTTAQSWLFWWVNCPFWIILWLVNPPIVLQYSPIVIVEVDLFLPLHWSNWSHVFCVRLTVTLDLSFLGLWRLDSNGISAGVVPLIKTIWLVCPMGIFIVPVVTNQRH